LLILYIILEAYIIIHIIFHHNPQELGKLRIFKSIVYNNNMEIDEKEFVDMVNAAVSLLPKEFVDKLENVSILISDYPSDAQFQKIYKSGDKGMLLGLYEGIPKTKRSYYGIGPTMPDTITIFRSPLMGISKNKVELIENIRSTVWHEIAHHFGMDERMVREAESSRNSRKKFN
jgi:predicted Zn-dependent protease with MMP-like domain